jgi:hypothetical protein
MKKTHCAFVGDCFLLIAHMLITDVYYRSWPFGGPSLAKCRRLSLVSMYSFVKMTIGGRCEWNMKHLKITSDDLFQVNIVSVVSQVWNIYVTLYMPCSPSHHALLILADNLWKSSTLTWVISWRDCTEPVVWTQIPNFLNVWVVSKFTQVLVCVVGYWFKFQPGHRLSWLKFLVAFLNTSSQMPGNYMKLAIGASGLFWNNYSPIILYFERLWFVLLTAL